ncbi:hypothetical protein Nepgr_015856 [Nepenthes gracilis]|uniref:Secreted protein n=1 Tax=Nepenthes gracilis TaxID=150966 RepID=A0AAD3SLM5_NEPGR|nr:hypothetical protein Nepgr_015856 [Nepenthes gracilis]
MPIAGLILLLVECIVAANFRANLDDARCCKAFLLLNIDISKCWLEHLLSKLGPLAMMVMRSDLVEGGMVCWPLLAVEERHPNRAALWTMLSIDLCYVDSVLGSILVVVGAGWVLAIPR